MKEIHFHFYKYIDDTGNSWSIKLSDYLAEVGGLEQIPFGNPENINPIGRNYKPRHINLVATADRPGMKKYCVDVVTNERDPSKFINKLLTVGDQSMRCIRYVGEQRTG